jgi:hypothetical protein
VRINDDATTVVDGPLATEGPTPGAFYLIECADREHALAWAARLPAAKYGSVEVRPLRPVPGPTSTKGA